MKMIFSIFTGCLILVVTQASFARDTLHDFPIASVMAGEKAKSKLSGVKFYFGDQKPGKVKKRFGVFSTNKKTNAFGKSDQEACEHVFLSAMIQLHQRALSLGGNAVINIKSNYKNNLTTSNETYKCGAGNVIAGVALQGEVVTLK